MKEEEVSEQSSMWKPMDKKACGKLPTVMQAIIGLAFLVYGAIMMLRATEWSMGDLRLLLLFLSVGALFIATAIPQLFEFMATALQEEKEQQALLSQKKG